MHLQVIYISYFKIDPFFSIYSARVFLISLSELPHTFVFIFLSAPFPNNQHCYISPLSTLSYLHVFLAENALFVIKQKLISQSNDIQDSSLKSCTTGALLSIAIFMFDPHTRRRRTLLNILFYFFWLRKEMEKVHHPMLIKQSNKTLGR